MVKKFKLDKKQKQFFDDYYFEGNNKKLVDKKNHPRYRQLYLYKRACQPGFNNQGLQKLLELIQKGIDKQYDRKNQIENRVGFLVALFGVLIGSLIEGNSISHYLEYIEKQNSELYLYFLKGLIFLLGLLFLLCIYQIYKCIKSTPIYRLEFSDFDNAKCAAEDSDFFVITMIEAYSDTWEKIENLVNEKGEAFNLLVVYIIVFSILTVMIEILGGL